MQTTFLDDELNWLNQHFQRAGIRDSDQIDSVMRFSLVWNLFEGEICDQHFSVDKVSKILKRIESRGNLHRGDFDVHLAYFIKRYVQDKSTNDLFQTLYFRPPDREELVRRVLLEEEIELTSKILALVIIVYRLRSNLFHGIKSLYSLAGQVENFRHANAILMHIIDLASAA